MVTKWRIAGCVFSSVVIVAVSVGYALRGFRLLVEGDELRGLVNLVGVGITWLVLIVGVVAVLAISRRRRRPSADQSSLAETDGASPEGTHPIQEN